MTEDGLVPENRAAIRGATVAASGHRARPGQALDCEDHSRPTHASEGSRIGICFVRVGRPALSAVEETLLSEAFAFH